MKPTRFDPVREACKLGARFHRYESVNKWCVLDARPNSDLWKMQFGSIQNAAKAFLIVHGKRETSIHREWNLYNFQASKEGKPRIRFSTFKKWVDEGNVPKDVKAKIPA